MDFRGERRSNATHASTTDPESRLAREGDGKEAKLSFAAHALTENRHGLLVDFIVTQATGTAERDAVPRLLDGARERGFRPRTLGADKSDDTVGGPGGSGVVVMEPDASSAGWTRVLSTLTRSARRRPTARPA